MPTDLHNPIDDIDPSWIDSEISLAELSLRKLYNPKISVCENHGNDNLYTQGTSISQSPASQVLGGKISRLETLRAQIDFMTAAHDFSNWEKNLIPNSGTYILSNGKSIVDPFVLGKLLEILNTISASYPTDPTSTNDKDLRVMMKDRYKFLFLSSRYAIQVQIRSFLRSKGYPKEDMCSHELQSDIRNFLMKQSESAPPSSLRSFNYNFNDLSSCCIYLMNLHIIHHHNQTMILGNNADILEDRSQPNDESIKGQNQDYTFKTSRIHILDELCRPIVERVMFHFSSIKSDTVKRPTNHANDNDDKNDRFVENKIVVEHLLDYIKNIIEVPLKMILKAIRPFMTYAVAQLQNHKVQTHEDHETNYNDSTPNVTHVPKLVYYFLNQMVNLAHHILKERDVFRDKKLLGSPPLFTHALEQILSFDQYILNCIYDYEPQGAHSPRLMDLLLLSTPTLLENWLSMEWKGASYLLSSCVVSEKEANVETRKQLNDRFRFNEIPHLVFVSSDAEMFLSLFHSFQRKYGLIANPKARDFIVTKILVPLSMQYLEQLHGSAKKLMKEFEVWGKNGNSAAEKRRSNDDEKIFHLTKDELLRKIIHEWCDILTGANLVIHILMEKQTDHNHINQYHTDGHNIEQNEISSSNFANDLSRVGNSLQRLQEAMIEECVAFLVENIMIEKAKMAMYLMQCPHLLSLSSCNHTGIYESPTISLDIIDAVHILSILTESCNEKLNHVFESCNNHVLDSVINGGSMIDYISFGADTLLSCMAIKISQKFLEIVLDDLQVFEIRLNGASQFLHDIEAVISLFKYADRSYSNMTIENNGAGMGELFVPNCFRRLYSLIKLMTLDWRQYQSLKNAMLDLYRYKLFGANSFGDSSPTDVDERRTLSLDTLESDTTVMSEARSMLDAKGFASLEISDAVLIMNRRTE